MELVIFGDELSVPDGMPSGTRAQAERHIISANARAAEKGFFCTDANSAHILNKRYSCALVEQKIFLPYYSTVYSKSNSFF